MLLFHLQQHVPITVLQRNESGSLLCFIIHSRFLSHPVSHINNSSKILANIAKKKHVFATEKHTSLQLALNL